MQIIEVKISDLKPYKENAKKHPKKQIDLLKANITKFGFTTPVLIDKNNSVIAGHGRLLAMKELGKESVPCVMMGDLTEEEVKALRLADNRIAEMGEWDMDLVIAELKGLEVPLLELTGFSSDLIITPEEADDAVGELPNEPVSKLGDLYELGSHRVICGDSTKLEDVERLMNGTVPDFVFADPPYGIDIVSNGKVGGDKIVESKEYSKIIGDNTTETAQAFYNTCRALEFKNIALWGGNYFTGFLPPSRCWIIWDKEMTGNFSEAEMAWTSFKKGGVKVFKFLWNGLAREGNKKDELKTRVHPTQKPVGLFVQIFLRFDGFKKIFDGFLGSGSTLIAAQKTNRVCYGMELDPKYVDVIVSRFCKYVGNNIIKKNGEEIDWITK